MGEAHMLFLKSEDGTERGVVTLDGGLHERLALQTLELDLHSSVQLVRIAHDLVVAEDDANRVEPRHEEGQLVGLARGTGVADYMQAMRHRGSRVAPASLSSCTLDRRSCYNVTWSGITLNPFLALKLQTPPPHARCAARFRFARPQQRRGRSPAKKEKFWLLR